MSALRFRGSHSQRRHSTLARWHRTTVDYLKVNHAVAVIVDSVADLDAAVGDQAFATVCLQSVGIAIAGQAVTEVAGTRSAKCSGASISTSAAAGTAIHRARGCVDAPTAAFGKSRLARQRTDS